MQNQSRQALFNYLKNTFDLKTFIPSSFIQKYNLTLGKNREYEIHSVLSALLIMHIFNIPTTTLLCLFLTFSEEMKEFCCFNNSIPDDSFLSRFKTTFEKEIIELFNSMSLHVIVLCDEINETLPDNHPDKNFRLYPGLLRSSDEWTKTYKTRYCIERELSCLKSNPCIATPLTTNTKKMSVDVCLAAISKLINVIVSYSLNNIEYIRTINPLFKIAATLV